MSTRGAIARITPKGFTGRYHHFDSYPEGLGRTLWTLYHGRFNKDLNKLLTVLIDEHPAGWSTLIKDWSQPISYGSDDGPQCYCRGQQSEPEQLVTERNARSSLCEWVYAFSSTHMYVLVPDSPRTAG